MCTVSRSSVGTNENNFRDGKRERKGPRTRKEQIWGWTSAKTPTRGYREGKLEP